MAVLGKNDGRRRMTDEEQEVLDELLDLPSDIYRFSDYDLEFVESIDRQRKQQLSGHQLRYLNLVCKRALGREIGNRR